MKRPRLREAIGGAILVLMALSAAYGGGYFGLRERFPPPAGVVRGDAFRPAGAAVDGAGGRGAQRRSSPYWRRVTRFAGTRSATSPAFAIDPGALQWRSTWRCARGAFAVQPRRRSGEDFGHALGRTDRCPQRGSGLSVAQGEFRLRVSAQGPWTVEVEEQVDVPVVETRPAVLASSRARRVAAGSFYGIDEHGEGRVEVWRLADGSAMIGLRDFYATPNVDLEIRLSTLERPRSTRDVDDAPFEDVHFLTATAGTMYFRVPGAALDDDVRSVVIWCEATHNAYAAAPLTAAPARATG